MITRCSLVITAGLFLTSVLLTTTAQASPVKAYKNKGNSRVVFLKNLAVKDPEGPVATATPIPTVSATATPGVVAALRYATAKSAAANTKDPVLAASNFVSSNASTFGIRVPSKYLMLSRAETDNIGMTHVRFTQRYNGVPVYGTEVIVHVNKQGEVNSANVNVIPSLAINTTPTYAQSKAEAGAVEIWRGEFGATGNPDRVSSQLYIMSPEYFRGEKTLKYYLVWAVNVSSAALLSDEVYFIDAKTGVLREKVSNVKRITRQVADCSYDTSPINNSCYSEMYDPITGYTFGRREGKPPRGPNPRYLPELSYDVDNMYDMLEVIHNYYLTTFRRDGGNGRGGIGNPYKTTGVYTDWGITRAETYAEKTVSWKDICPAAAFVHNSVVFCKDTIAADIVGHEYSHSLAYFSHYSGSGAPVGMLYQGQSGALDENQADVFGEAIEKIITGSNDWISGTQWPTGPTRDMANPPNIPQEGGHPSPDRFMSPQFYCGYQDNYGVHINSTVLSKAAWLLAVGGKFNGCTIKAVGPSAMNAIWYRAVTQYYGENETFNGAYYGLVQACKDIYGVNTKECIQVARALQSVEIDQPGYCSGESGSTPACRCQDSDSGIDYYNRGVVTDGDAKNHPDYCMSRTNLVEYSCSNGEMKSKLYTCPSGYKCINKSIDDGIAGACEK